MVSEEKDGGKFRFVDFLVILFCLTGAVYSINLFRHDLFQTINGQNKTAIGIVSSKRNTVQRRMSNRVLWDRLIKESSVYSDDMIRVGDNSSADIHVGGNDIALNENTLVRLRYNEETGEYHIELASGNLGLVTSPEGKNVVLNIMGRKVEAKPGTALNAATANNGVALQVSKGSAAMEEEGQNRELVAVAAVAMDSAGSVSSEPSALVIQPRPNAIYRKNGSQPLNINFSWSRINLKPNETLRLEIAEDQDFSRSVRTLNELNDSAQTALNNGQWNWRLIYSGDSGNGAVLGLGRFTITNISGPELLSPAKNQQFFYETEPPKLNFQWTETEDVSYYIIEADSAPDFKNPVIKQQTAVTFIGDSSLEEGTWYWRVTPVFSTDSEDSNVNPPSAAFRIVKGKEQETPSFFNPSAEEPATASTPERPSPPARVVLESPSHGTTLQGLTALRQQTVFRWSSKEAVAKSRFVLSRNSNPLAGTPAIEIIDPNRTIRVDRLEEGVWYWTVSAQTPAGQDITAKNPQHIRVLPIPLLPSPADRQPVEGYRIGIDELKRVNVNFKWSAVQGANAYIFTLYQRTGNGRRQITQIGPENRTSWSTDVKTLGRGSFVWQVEAVNAGRYNVVEQRGRVAETSFVVDIPRPGPVQIIKQPEAVP
ncbi:MAG: hypothetical protein LBV17_06720 [Treponema sp.]|jgi:hypothetical protein|nr:hypothetical protein [Treponema sp.]